MVVLADGYLDWTTKRDAPIWKQYTTKNVLKGVAFHSAEGWAAGSDAEIQKTSRLASWIFFVLIDGTVWQYYPIWASAWASGNRLANTTLMSLECEGTKNTPLSDAQDVSVKRLVGEWAAFTGNKPIRAPGALTNTMWEHNEVALWEIPNAGPTACPSHRYDDIFTWIQEDMDIKPDAPFELGELEEKVAALERTDQAFNTITLQRYDLELVAKQRNSLAMQKAWELLEQHGMLLPQE